MNILEEKGKEMKIPGFKKDKLIVLIDNLVTQSAYLKEDHAKRLAKSNLFVPLNAKVMKSQVGNYAPYLRLLENEHIIECDGSYQEGEISKGYKFTPQYEKYDVTNIELKDFCLARNLKKYVENKSKTENKHLRHLEKWFKTEALNIDSKRALEWIAEKEISELKEAKSEQKQNSIKLKHQGYRISVKMFVDKRYSLKEDKTGYRFHTPLTNLKKDLRNFISYDGKQLVSIDIKNSQPFFSSMLFKISFWESLLIKQKNEKKGKGRNIKGYGSNIGDIDINTIIMLLNSPVNQYCIDFHKNKYIQLVEKGKFYDYLIKPLKENSIINESLDHEASRAIVKQKVLTILFDADNVKYKTMANSPYQIFKKEFPEIAALFEQIKANKYNQLAVLLQRIESQAVLHDICKKLENEHKEIPVFTIHDSIVTTAANVEIVNQVMKDVLKEKTGINPSFSIEPWCNDCDNEFQIAA